MGVDMGSAAFCSECTRWVWVSPDGGCTNGHQRSCLRSVHEASALPVVAAPTAPSPVAAAPAAQPAFTATPTATPVPSSSGNAYAPEWASVGLSATSAAYAGAPSAAMPASPGSYGFAPAALQGGLPAGVSSFNWGAFFFPVLWPFVYGLNTMGWIAFGATLAANFFGGILPGPLRSVAGLIPLGISIWVGLQANAEYWKTNPKRLSVEEFRSKQPKWIWIGIGMGVVGLLVGVAVVLFALAALRGLAGTVPAQPQMPIQFQ